MYPAATRRALAAALADAFLSGPWDQAEMIARGRQALRPAPSWLERLADEVLDFHHRPPLDRPRELAALIAVLLERRTGRRPAPRVVRRLGFVATTVRRPWPVPRIDTVADLAAFFELELGAYEWLADARSLERRVADEGLRRYRYAWVARDGGPPRVLERPKGRLKAAQRVMLREILDVIPPHEAAHGFRRGRSVQTHAVAHTRARVVLRFDLEDFFASVTAGRVFGLLRTAGYPEGVAHSLCALATNAVPIEEWAKVPRPRDPRAIDAHHRLGRRLATPHLPQGAPTSPAIANLAAHGLDRRLTGLAAAFGDARYTRYADDLSFSGGIETLRRAEPLRRAVAAIAAEEGFRVNERKSRLMSQAGRQQLCGIIVNEHPNITRAEYDTLKAILHNAAVHGPADTDNRAHLLGRISWVQSLNPERGAKLRARFDRIEWHRHDRS